MDKMTRRETLNLLARGGLACGGACALSRLAILDALAEDAADKDPFQVATVDFVSEPGRKLSRLGFGMMRLPCKGRGEIDEELSDKLVDYAIRHGVNYFDTAWMYIGGKSQYYTGKVLEKYDREKLFIVNKMPGGHGARGLDNAKEIFRKQLEACRTKYFDIYLLHALGDYRGYERFYLKGGVLDFLKGEREAGRIRHLGFSFHGGQDDLRRFLDQKESAGWDVVMLQMSANGVGREFYEIAKPTGLPIVVMEPLHAGRLANLNVAARKALEQLKPGLSPAGWALRWVSSQPNVAVAISGMARLSDVIDNCNTYRDFKPLTEAEIASYHAICEKYKGANLLPCTGCAYCAPCPHGVDIPGVFGLVNACRTDGILGPKGDGKGMSAADRKKFLDLYREKVGEKADASRCTACGNCHPKCPQHIKVAKEFRKINAMVESIRKESEQDTAAFDFGENTLVAYLADGTEWTSRERGVKPILDAIDGARERFAGARCYDRIVGRAAAFLYAKLGVKSVFAPVMATGAVAILKRHGIEPSFTEEVPGIRNRANDGPCPMEHAVRDIADTDVDAAIAAIRAQREKLLKLPLPNLANG